MASHRSRVRRAEQRATITTRGKPMTRVTRIAMDQAMDDLETLAHKAVEVASDPTTTDRRRDAALQSLDDLETLADDLRDYFAQRR
jgi:hypothetical protein